ncbi:osteopetrosis-associated transmembrane protein 1 isoform X2 [Coregonus clupeaformis]|uniref:osteopetrosis-associated transmembrane protein 1 isoform X2 n=1 Tax=Coregonus clupeaformis TaxID=59861 RepID=UPI001E1C5E95|nr:osteopetrosis-associated transmembrane protein 1 isoform X2 [Coregonus clupeaformis]
MFIVQVGTLLIALVYYGNAQTSIVAVNTTIPGSELSANGLKQRAAVVVPQSPVFHPGLRSQFSLNLLSAFPEDLEVSDYCFELLAIFGQRYSTYVNCLVSAARPVKVCQNCYGTYSNLMEIYKNISSDQMGPGNVSCRDSLLRSDRLMLVFLLYNNLEDIWTASECNRCVSPGHHSLTNDTLYFMATLNQSLSCFEKYQKGNHSELCKECKATYRGLNELYSRMEKNHTLCIDIEDSMNMTRILWSKNFNCSFPRAETVPVIAVSSFMLFLPVIFYLSSFLHSEQKKRKLIHPKRAKSNTSFMNIQDKFS